MYITNNREGGYGNKNSYERESETIYAGVDTSFGPGEPRPTGIGPLCELVPKSGADKAAESSTFEVTNAPVKKYQWPDLLVGASTLALATELAQLLITH